MFASLSHFSWAILVLFFFTGLAAGLVDVVAGGGGLVATPVLLNLGIPPIFAIGTNRFQSLIGSALSTYQFTRHGHLRWRELWPSCIVVALSASIGTILLQFSHPEFIERLIPFLLLAILVYTILTPAPHEQGRPRISWLAFAILIGGSIGFYNGFFGPGTGSFWIFVFVFFLGFDLQSATIHAKPLNLIGNILSTFWFIIGHHILYGIAIILGLGQIVGTQLGVLLVIHKGSRWIRPIFLLVVLALTVSLFIKAYAL